MTKAQILIEIHEMRGEYAHKMSEDLKRIGKAALGGVIFLGIADSPLTRSYREAQAKVSVLDELLEKIANTPEDTGNPKSNPFCNDIIRDADGNEIARARG
jgi:hypothetical protein